MTEIAFRVVVSGLRFGPDRPKIQAEEIASPLRHYGFEGVTVTPMDDALIKAAELVFRDLDKGEFPTATVLDVLRAAIANARGDGE